MNQAELTNQKNIFLFFKLFIISIMSSKKIEYDHNNQMTFGKWEVCDSNNTKIQTTIDSCKKNPFLYKFISSNDAGSTGSHQSGIYLPNSSWPFFFDSPGVKGKNKDRNVTIQWEGEHLETNNRFIWYGEKTRREYRLTRFGRGFPYLKDEYIGSLMILIKTGENDLNGCVLDSDSDIENFLAQFNIPHLDAGGIRNPVDEISRTEEKPFDRNRLFSEFIGKITTDFPETIDIARVTRDICASSGLNGDPDDHLTSWLDTEYQLFRLIENKMYDPFIKTGNHSLEEILGFASGVLNRRKSRAGKSLEHHLAAIFDGQKLPYTHGEITEGHSRPDFIFPGMSRYHDIRYSEDGLVFLGAKTTCKDRWRQILSEAERINRKHLFTLQQGVSSNQLEEMERSNVTLVVPKQNLNCFPKPWQPRLMTLGSFIQFVKTRTAAA